MAGKGIKRLIKLRNGSLHTEIREKLGMTQAQLAALFQISRSYIAHIESGKRNLESSSNTMLINMYNQFNELEAGRQLSKRSIETRLFLNDEYKKLLPKMKLQEQEYRFKIKFLKKDLAAMKERAKIAEHAIIVFTTAVKKLEEKKEPGNKTENMITGLNLFKQQAYDHLLTCWEPEQAKLHGKIEAIAGEARALRRYRVKVMKEQGLKEEKRKKIKQAKM